MPLEYLPCAQQFTNMSALKFVLYSHTPQRLMPERKVSLFSWVLVLLARMRYQQLLPVSGASEELAPCKPLFGNVGSFPKGTRTVQDCKRTGNGVSIGLQEDLPQRVGEFPEHVSCKIWSFYGWWKQTPCSHEGALTWGCLNFTIGLLRRHHFEPCLSSSGTVGGPELHRGWAGEVAAWETGRSQRLRTRGPFPISRGCVSQLTFSFFLTFQIFTVFRIIQKCDFHCTWVLWSKSSQLHIKCSRKSSEYLPGRH